MKCPTTGKATRQTIPGVLLTRRYTEALADEIGRYADRAGVLEVSRHYAVDYKTVLVFEKAHLARKKAYSQMVPQTRIGVDEVKLGSRGRRVMVSDLDTRRPIWMVKSHWEGIASWCDEANHVPLGFV